MLAGEAQDPPPPPPITRGGAVRHVEACLYLHFCCCSFLLLLLFILIVTIYVFMNNTISHRPFYIQAETSCPSHPTPLSVTSLSVCTVEKSRVVVLSE